MTSYKMHQITKCWALVLITLISLLFPRLHAQADLDPVESSPQTIILDETAHLFAADAAIGDEFGYAVASEGDIAVVTAPFDDGTTGINQGGAYIFYRNQGGAGQWGQVRKLLPSDASAGDLFGLSVAISGNTIAIGSPHTTNTTFPDQGAVYIFYKDQGGVDNWGQVRKISVNPANGMDLFGVSIALDGDTLVAGAPYVDRAAGADQGAAYVFYRNQGGPDAWGLVVELTGSAAGAGNHFGESVAASLDTVVVGSPLADGTGGIDQGAAHVFGRDLGGTGAWGEAARVTATAAAAGDKFGTGLAIEGDLLVVGSPQFDGTGGVDQGAIYTFLRNQGGPGQWGQTTRLTTTNAASQDQFGFSLSLDQYRLLAGAPRKKGTAGLGQGYAYLFSATPNQPGTWQQDSVLVAGDAGEEDWFGYDVDFNVDNLFIGALNDNGTAGVDQGSAYMYSIIHAPPVAFANRYTTNEQATLEGNIILDNTGQGVDTDPEGGALVISAVLGDPARVGSSFSLDSGASLSVDAGGGFNYDPTTSSAWNSLAAGQNAVDVFDYTLQDTDLLTSTAQVTITVAGLNDAPQISPANLDLATDTADENSIIALNGYFSDVDTGNLHTVTIQWDDGSQTSLNLPAGEFNFNANHTYLDDPHNRPTNLYNIVVGVSDGVASANTSIQVAINNLAPQISSVNTASIFEGETAVLSGSISDPGPQDLLSLRIEWGDGAFSQVNYPLGTTTFNQEHVYADDNPGVVQHDTYTVTLILSDDDGGQITSQTTVTVGNLAPQVNAGIDLEIRQGQVVDFQGSFTDNGLQDTHTIDWDFGDGSTAAGSLTPTHTYTQTGTYTVTLTITDDDGGVSSDTLQVTVNDPFYYLYLPRVVRQGTVKSPSR